MEINELKLSGFGNFSDSRIIQFQPNKLGLILGKNESGKSTIISALFTALYGLKPSDKKRWKSWEKNNDFLLNLQFSHEGKKYSLERNLENNTVRLIEIGKNEKIYYDDYHVPSEKFNRIYFNAFDNILPLPPKTVLESCNVIFEHQLRVQINADLRQIITGTSETDYEDVLESLEREYYSLTSEKLPWHKTGGKRKNGLIEENKEQLEQYQEDIDESIKYFENQKQIQQNLLKAESERNKIEHNLPLYKRLLLQLKVIERIEEKKAFVDSKKAEIITQLDAVSAVIKEEEKIQKKLEKDFGRFLQFEPAELEMEISRFLLFKKRIKEKKEKLDEFRDEIDYLIQEQKALPDFSDAPANFLYLLETIQASDEEIPELEKRKKKVELKARQFKGKLVNRSILAVLFLVVSIIAFVITFLLYPFEIMGWGIAALTFFSAIIIFFAEAYPAIKKYRAEQKELNEILSQLKQKQKLKSDNKNLISKFSNSSFTDLKVEYDRYKNFQNKIEEYKLLAKSVENEIKELSEEPEYQMLTEKYSALLADYPEILNKTAEFRKLINEKNDLRHQLNAFPKVDTLQNKIESFRQEISNYELEKKTIFDKFPVVKKLLKNYEVDRLIAKIEKESSEAQSKLSALDRSITTYRIQLQEKSKLNYVPDQLIDEKQLLQEELESFEKRRYSLLLALEVLRESIYEFRNDYLTSLNSGISGFLKKIIDPLLYEVSFNNDFDLNIQYKNLPVLVDQLSSGTRDQLYFSYRLVLSELLTSTLHFPIIIDDAFVHFDNQRLENVFSLLNEIKKDYQVLVCSSNSDYSKFCDYVINLDEDFD